MQIEVNGTLVFPDHCMGVVRPTRADMWKWRLWWRFFGHKKPAPYENMYVITSPFTGQKIAMVSPAMFNRLKAEVENRFA